MKNELKKFDSKEFDLPETTFSRNIDNKVLQGIILQCLSNIDGIALIEGNFIDNIFGRQSHESLKGIIAEQEKNQGVNIKLELNICYGCIIPDKAEEIQVAIVEEITRLTGLHVASIHIAFKSLLSYDEIKKMALPLASGTTTSSATPLADEYNDEF